MKKDIEEMKKKAKMSCNFQINTGDEVKFEWNQEMKEELKKAIVIVRRIEGIE